MNNKYIYIPFIPKLWDNTISPALLEILGDSTIEWRFMRRDRVEFARYTLFIYKNDIKIAGSPSGVFLSISEMIKFKNILLEYTIRRNGGYSE